MARRREKRSSATENSERRKNRDESKPGDGQAGEPDSDRRLMTIFVVFFIVIPAVSMSLYKVKFADRVIQTESSIRQKEIIKTDIHFQEILTFLGTVSDVKTNCCHPEQHGNDFAVSGGDGGAITGRDYLALLRKHKPTLHWDKESGEHLFMYRDDKNIKHAVFYPTLMSILVRLENARLWGIGSSIWETRFRLFL